MDIKDLRQKTPDQLKAQLLDLRKEQFSMRMQKATGQLTQTHQIRKVRREIAQIKQLLGTQK